MSGFSQDNSFWGQQNDQPYQPNTFYQAEYNQFQNQNLGIVLVPLFWLKYKGSQMIFHFF